MTTLNCQRVLATHRHLRFVMTHTGPDRTHEQWAVCKAVKVMHGVVATTYCGGEFDVYLYPLSDAEWWHLLVSIDGLMSAVFNYSYLVQELSLP